MRIVLSTLGNKLLRYRGRNGSNRKDVPESRRKFIGDGKMEEKGEKGETACK